MTDVPQHETTAPANGHGPERPPLTVVMPAYNEEGAIVDAVADVQTHVLDLVPGAELMVVNDGSRDGTEAILDGIVAEDGRVRAIHQKNTGHGGAVMRGLSEARGHYVMLIDSDRQIPLDSFGRFWEEAKKGRDAVFGVRTIRHDAKIRIILTRIVRKTLGLLFATRLHDANVPYKLLKRDLWESASRFIPEGTLAPSLFLAVYARVSGADIAEIEVTHLDRATGEVSIKRWKLFKFCWVAFRQLLAFRRQVRGVR